jgi:hypothetical protein
VEVDGCFRITSDREDPIVVLLMMMMVAKPDHGTNIINPVRPILKHVMRMCLADYFAFRHSTNPIAKRQIPFLTPCRMIADSYQSSTRSSRNEIVADSKSEASRRASRDDHRRLPFRVR